MMPSHMPLRDPRNSQFFDRKRSSYSANGIRPGNSHSFKIDLILEGNIAFLEEQPDIRCLLDQSKSLPDGVVFSSGGRTASLYFREWDQTLSCLVSLWDLRLSGFHAFTPKLRPSARFSCGNDLDCSMKALFLNKVNDLIEDAEVLSLKQKAVHITDKIEEVVKLLSMRNKLGLCNELICRKERLIVERDLLRRRLYEFQEVMQGMVAYLNGESKKDEAVGLFVAEKGFDWTRLHSLLSREIRRLKEALPIYAYRHEILNKIKNIQVMVLVGETGSGKSTQLVQFLADAGFAANGSIVCTQPRKIAATSLADRVKEECRGCYGDNDVVSHPSSLSSHHLSSKIIYTTDNCLLQYLIFDKRLLGISCIIIDEVHERSLNTDLLLALIRNLVPQRSDLKVVIMSATAKSEQFSRYYFGCEVFHVIGRNFPVDIEYIPYNASVSVSTGAISPHVHEVLNLAVKIHNTEDEGAILAFLTSQMEVEWACERFHDPSAVSLALHGKLSFEDQCHVFQRYPGKRKVIFSTNIAETSVTIPGVKYVIDSGLAKVRYFDHAMGLNVLRVCMISKSSAQQRAGRAGRTGPGRCYRLYSESDFESMSLNQEPEICRVHLGIAFLKILALGVRNIHEFNFVDAPSERAIDMAVRNLSQLGAIKSAHDGYVLTEEGHYLVRLGIEPRLGKLILSCFHHRLRKEGVILAAVMANSSSIFCRVGNHDEKQKADCLKVQFCHSGGDLFTLLSVYKEWENVPFSKRNHWCWENSVNAKSMRRCYDTVKELETCLEKELSVVIPTYWCWDPLKLSEHHGNLSRIIVLTLSENIAMYSGHDQLGYEVYLTGQHVHLHPSCSLLAFNTKPKWVVFDQILSTYNHFMVCVTAFDVKLLSPSLSFAFDLAKMETHRLEMRVVNNVGSVLLRKFCGKSNCRLISLISCIRACCTDERITIEVNVEQNEILVFATSRDMNSVLSMVNEALVCERKWLGNECLERQLHNGTGQAPVALIGSGAEIRHLEFEQTYLSVDVFISNGKTVDDKELLLWFEKLSSGCICSVHKSSGVVQDEMEKWGRITFLSPDAARLAAGLNGCEFNGSNLMVVPAQTVSGGGNHERLSFPAVKAKVCWPRRYSKGVGLVTCDVRDLEPMLNDFSGLTIGGSSVRCKASRHHNDAIFLSGIDRELSQDDVLRALEQATKRRVLKFSLVKEEASDGPLGTYHEALTKEISAFMPRTASPLGSSCKIQLLSPEPKDCLMKALITFDGRLHLEAAKALENLNGKVLPGCFPWQKIKCQQLFHSSLSCSASVYFVIQKQLNSLLERFKNVKGVECSLDRNKNGSYRVKLSAKATRTIAKLRKPLEDLMNGRTVRHRLLTPDVMQHLFSRQGFGLRKILQKETGTYIWFDRNHLSIRIFGSSENVALAEQKLFDFLVTYHENKQLEISLKDKNMPSDLMKEVVREFGPDLSGLKERVPGAEFTLNTRRHVIYVRGEGKEKQRAEEMILDIAKRSYSCGEIPDSRTDCPICLCPIESRYQLEGCMHAFCRGCLTEQLESASKSLDSFPICCSREGCDVPVLVTDLKSLALGELLDELFRASLGSYVARSNGALRFCPSPDCPSVYRAACPGEKGEPFFCGACGTETCTSCHMEYHPFISCAKYQEFKEDPDSSLKEWCKEKDVKRCPVCGYNIEKLDGCNHMECRCGQHICWVCLASYDSSSDCYGHLNAVHASII